MSNCVQDTDRPDVDGVKPKMQAIRDACASVLFKADLVPSLSIHTDDNIMSSVTIKGTFDPPNEWKNGIEYNSRHFRFVIVPMEGMRYYNTLFPDKDDSKVTVELEHCQSNLSVFRKYTATPEKVIAKIKTWMERNKKP